MDSRRCVELVWKIWASRHGLDAAAIVPLAHGRRTSETLREIAPYLDIPSEVAILDALEESEHRGVRAGPGARDLLAQLAGAPWAIVTSAGRAIARMRLGLAGLPEPSIMITGADVARGKPAPDGYLQAAAALRRSAPACVVIEDAPAGIAAGKAAGMAVIAVRGTYSDGQLGEANCIVDSLADLRCHRADVAGIQLGFGDVE